MDYLTALSYTSTTDILSTLNANTSKQMHEKHIHSLNLQHRFQTGSHLSFIQSVQSVMDRIEALDYYRNAVTGYVINQVINAFNLIADKASEDISRLSYSLNYNRSVVFNSNPIFKKLNLHQNIDLLIKQHATDYRTKQQVAAIMISGDFTSSLQHIRDALKILKKLELQKGMYKSLYGDADGLQKDISKTYKFLLEHYHINQKSISPDSILNNLPMLHLFREPDLDVVSLSYTFKYSADDVKDEMAESIERYLEVSLQNRKYEIAYQNVMTKVKDFIDKHVVIQNKLENDLLKSVNHLQQIAKTFWEKTHVGSEFMRYVHAINIICLLH